MRESGAVRRKKCLIFMVVKLHRIENTTRWIGNMQGPAHSESVTLPVPDCTVHKEWKYLTAFVCLFCFFFCLNGHFEVLLEQWCFAWVYFYQWFSRWSFSVQRCHVWKLVSAVKCFYLTVEWPEVFLPEDVLSVVIYNSLCV